MPCPFCHADPHLRHCIDYMEPAAPAFAPERTVCPDPTTLRGSDYQADIDEARLLAGLTLTLRVMADGVWRTKAALRREILQSHATDVSEESIGRYLRYARERANGGWKVQKRRVGSPGDGLYEYRFLP